MNPVDIIVAGDIEIIHKTIDIRTRKEIARGSDRTRRILAMRYIHQTACNFVSTYALVRDLISQYIQGHARMIAVATNHPREIGLGPLVEVKMIGIWHLTIGCLAITPFLPTVPFVENLICDKKTKAIAQIVHIRCEWVVTQAKGITSHILQCTQSLRPYFGRHGHSKWSYILVQTHSAEFLGLTIDLKTIFRKFHRPDAHSHTMSVDHSITAHQTAFESIERWSVGRP